MTAPTSRQLRLAMGLARPFSVNAWAVLSFIAGETIDVDRDHGRHLVVEASQGTIARRTGIRQSSVGAALHDLEERGLVNVLNPAAGRQARWLQIEGAFDAWKVTWRIDRTAALHVLADAGYNHPLDWSLRRVCDRSLSESQREVNPPSLLPVRRIHGEFVPTSWDGYNADIATTPRMVTKRRPAARRALSQVLEEPVVKRDQQQQRRRRLSTAQEAVRGAILEHCGVDPFGRPGDAMYDTLRDVEDATYITAAIRTSKSTYWKDTYALVAHLAEVGPRFVNPESSNWNEPAVPEGEQLATRWTVGEHLAQAMEALHHSSVLTPPDNNECETGADDGYATAGG